MLKITTTTTIIMGSISSILVLIIYVSKINN